MMRYKKPGELETSLSTSIGAEIMGLVNCREVSTMVPGVLFLGARCQLHHLPSM